MSSDSVRSIREFDNAEVWMTLDGKYHREDGPAIISADKSTQCWFIDDHEHREDGPAVIYKDGNDNTIYRWYLRGKKYGYSEYSKELMKHYNKSNIDMLALKLRYSYP